MHFWEQKNATGEFFDSLLYGMLPCDNEIDMNQCSNAVFL